MLISFGILWLSGPRLFVWVTERSPTGSSNPTVVFQCSVLSHKWSLPDQRELQSSPDLRKGNCFRVSFGRVCSKQCILIWYQYAPLMTIRFTNERKNLISITALVWQCSINLMYFNSASFLFKRFLLTSTWPTYFFYKMYLRSTYSVCKIWQVLCKSLGEFLWDLNRGFCQCHDCQIEKAADKLRVLIKPWMV